MIEKLLSKIASVARGILKPARLPAAVVRALRAQQRSERGYYATEFQRGPECAPARRRRRSFIVGAGQ